MASRCRTRPVPSPRSSRPRRVLVPATCPSTFPPAFTSPPAVGWLRPMPPCRITGCIGRGHPRDGRNGKAGGIVDVHVAVTGTLRRLELRGLGTGRVRHLLAMALPADCRCRSGYRHHRGSLDESTACDHVDLPLPQNPYKGWGTRRLTVKTVGL